MGTRTKKNCEIRRLTAEELPLLLQLYTYNDPEEMLESNTRLLADGCIDVFGLFLDGKLIGELRASYESEQRFVAERGVRAYLYAFRIDKAYRHKGYGKMLLKHVIDLLENEAGYPSISIGVETNDRRARKMYEKNGFDLCVARSEETYQGDTYTFDLLVRGATEEELASAEQDDPILGGWDYIGLQVLLGVTVYTFYEKLYGVDWLIAGYFVARSDANFFVACLIIVLSLLGILITWDERTKLNAIETACFPLIYALLLCSSQYLPTLTLLAALLLAIGFAITAIVHLVRMLIKRGFRIRAFLRRVRETMFIPMSYLMPVMVVAMLFLPATVPTVQPETAQHAAADGQVDLASYHDTLVLLREDVWRGGELDMQDKLDVLQTVCNIECAYLGTAPVQLTAEESNATSFGAYNHASGTIRINRKLLRYLSAEVCIETVCHEVFHHFQHTVCDGNAFDWDSAFVRENAYFRPALRWRENLADYQRIVTDDASFDAYAAQAVEVDADAYASERLEKVYADFFAVPQEDMEKH